MRIIVAHSRLNSFGGGERCTLELLRRLSRRHDVLLWAGDYQPEATFPALAEYPRRELPAWGWLSARPNADVVVAHSFGAHLLALRHSGTLCYMHTLRAIYQRGGWRPDLVARRLLERLALRRAAYVLANSAFTAARTEHRSGRTVEVVPPGVDETLLELPDQPGEYALYVGRLAPEKGIERLLAWNRDLPVHLVIAGTGPAGYTAYLRSLAGSNAEFVGPVTGTRLAELYAGCRFLAFLPHEEEFGLAALEAMAAAKPVVASPSGGLVELVQHERTGLLVESAATYAAAVRRLLASDALCLRLGNGGRHVARTYTWDRYAERIEELCRMALTGGRGSSAQA
jgi:glycosyltransferase involved in cell wall biosynthesis